jgi:hypothetical protein
MASMSYRSIDKSFPNQWSSLELSHRLSWFELEQPVRGRKVGAFLPQLHVYGSYQSNNNYFRKEQSA